MALQLSPIPAPPHPPYLPSPNPYPPLRVFTTLLTVSMGYACKIISFLVSLFWSPQPHAEICQSVPCLCASHFFGQFISILNICIHIRACYAIHTNLTYKSVRKCDVRGEAYWLLHSRDYFWETPGHCCKFASNPTLIYQLKYWQFRPSHLLLRLGQQIRLSSAFQAFLTEATLLSTVNSF